MVHPLSFDRIAKLKTHLEQQHHKIAQQAYKRGVQQGHGPPAATAVPGDGLFAAQPQAENTVRPQDVNMTGKIYAQGFQDGMQAGKAAQNSVIKAMLDNQKLEIDRAFKRRKDHSRVGAAQGLDTNVGKLPSDLP